MIKLDIEIGDLILTGKFKNKKVIVKDFGTDEKGQPTVNGRKMLNFRIKKLMPDQTTNEQDEEEQLRLLIRKTLISTTRK